MKFKLFLQLLRPEPYPALYKLVFPLDFVSWIVLIISAASLMIFFKFLDWKVKAEDKRFEEIGSVFFVLSIFLEESRFLIQKKNMPLFR